MISAYDSLKFHESIVQQRKNNLEMALKDHKIITKPDKNYKKTIKQLNKAKEEVEDAIYKEN